MHSFKRPLNCPVRGIPAAGSDASVPSVSLRIRLAIFLSRCLRSRETEDLYSILQAKKLPHLSSRDDPVVLVIHSFQSDEVICILFQISLDRLSDEVSLGTIERTGKVFKAAGDVIGKPN